MKVIRIPTDEIEDWETFHNVMQRVLGLPDFYGRNLDALIDCLSEADDPQSEMCTVGDLKEICIDLGDISRFSCRCTEQYLALCEIIPFVNHRRISCGQTPAIALSFNGPPSVFSVPSVAKPQANK